MNNQITCPCGEILGTSCRLDGVVAFKGIRYATAGRWEYPKQVTSWEGVYDATSYGNCSYQPRAFYNEEDNIKKIFYYNEFRKGEKYTYSEDCLFLNVWTPESATADSRLPVLFYIHGGGFTGGCGHEKHFDDPVWPTKDVIAVTINYRLGPMGFLCLPELTEEAGHSGNYGLYDQLCAMKWVKDNIAAFGGDPDKITIMGQSAGAMSVQLQCQSPLTDGIFRAAVMSSGCGMTDMMMASPEKVYPLWQTVMAKLGCESLEQFRKVSPDKLFEAWEQAKKEVKGAGLGAAPVKDGHFIVGGTPPKNIPYIIGANSHDIAPPVLYSMGKSWGKKHSVTTWGYHLARMIPGDDNGSWHSADLWYWFGTLENCWRPLEKRDYEISESMVNYLCNFAKEGKPSGDPAWTSLVEDDKIMIFGDRATEMGKPSLLKLIKIMLTNKAVGE